MRKLLALTLAGIFVLGACSGNDDDKTSSQNKSHKKEKKSDKKESNNHTEQSNASQNDNVSQNDQQMLTKEQAIDAVKDEVLDGAGAGPGSQISDMKVIKETSDNYHVEFKSGSETHGVVKQVMIINKYTGQRAGYYQTDKGTNKMKEGEALQIAKNHFNGGVIRPGEIDFNSFQLEGAKSNNKYYFVRYNVTRLSEPIPFELKIDKDKKKVVDSKSLGTKKQMEELSKVSEEDERKDREAKEKVPNPPNNQDKQNKSEDTAQNGSSDEQNKAPNNSEDTNEKQTNNDETTEEDHDKENKNNQPNSNKDDQEESQQEHTDQNDSQQNDSEQDANSDENEDN
ncbi:MULTISPECIES: hypothetical protein [Staphylococcus]|uniref:Lipoprotein n=1 Tax=Staphylococcus pettenkoferi TaxID=170573 RepID=A0A2N6QLG9_9STAP|nr:MULTISPECIES: hypothetical protein [Staphylococcus]MCI2791021.1 hypothetical protein [Staphylococcus pettenkoferi]MCY1566809.1 hypothetical protein [Staphylococcus pettenkoferi]MCY1587567.1 hypothetical protein [Staphylococcus pettenkoferi]OFK74629.1 hypothetical protein HMPREF2802_06325 [Staphylococcus sp. HMSC071G07]PMC20527.1 hypothetical protein CJ235_02315 [Staphylococcus pettenkoferi]